MHRQKAALNLVLRTDGLSKLLHHAAGIVRRDTHGRENEGVFILVETSAFVTVYLHFRVLNITLFTIR